MQLAIKCVSYVAIVVGLSLTLASGVRWLVSPDPAAARVTYTPPIPPRIADSIERKKELPPPPPPVVATAPAMAQPAMQNANVALHPPPRPREVIRELRVRPPGAKPRVKPDERLQAQAPPVVPAREVVTTARSDVPY
jgi:hypothetical protein